MAVAGRKLKPGPRPVKALLRDPRPALSHTPPSVEDVKRRAEEYEQGVRSSHPEHASDYDLEAPQWVEKM
eukprot:12376870-Alexandrium_andersonii.AAC.1